MSSKGADRVTTVITDAPGEGVSSGGPRFEVVLVSYRSRPHVETLVDLWGDEVPVVVVDNARGVDGLEEWCAGHAHVRYVDAGGVGFARAANLGASTSSAEFVVFVNPDSRPSVGDLVALVGGLAADPLSVSHAATVTGADGEVEIGVAGWEPDVLRTAAYTVGLHKVWPEAGVYAKPELGRRLAVDWTTGACMAVRRAQFLRLGGFDESFFVYSEDMSFGRRAREAGLRQVLRPDVVVAHGAGNSGAPSSEMMRLKGASFRNYVTRYHGAAGTVMAGTLGLGYLARAAAKTVKHDERGALYLDQARGLFTGTATVGGEEVAARRMAETDPQTGAPLVRDGADGRPVLIVTKEFGEPATSGGMLRTLALARFVAAHTNVVVVAPSGVFGLRKLSDGRIVTEQLREAAHASRPADLTTAARYRSIGALRSSGAGLTRELTETLRELGPFRAAIVDHTSLFGLTGLLPAGLPVVLSTHNVESDLMSQRSRAESGALRVAAIAEAALLRRLEKGIGTRYPTIVCTRHDADVVAADGNPSVVVARNGVTPPEAPGREAARASTPHGTELLFTGALDWRPNMGGLVWLVESPQWAALCRRRPDVVLTVAGRNPSPEFRSRLEAAPGVRVEANVPSMTPLLERARLGVAPLLEGGGSRIKLLEYAAHGLPSVSTAVGASGLDGLPEGVIVQTPEDLDAFCAAVERTLDEGPESLSRQQVEGVLAVYGWDRALTPVAEVLGL